MRGNGDQNNSKFRYFLRSVGYGEKRLDEKAKVNFKTYDVLDWATNISRSKGNQAMKFGNLT